MSLLSICQDVCYETGVIAPSTIVGNTDSTARQLFRLANRTGEELSQASPPWEFLISEHTITLVSGTQTYALPSDIRWQVPDTTWNRTDDRRVVNPLSAKEWATEKGYETVGGLELEARIKGNLFEIEQDVGSGEDGDIIAFEYISDKWAQTNVGVAQKKFQSDTDSCLLCEELITQGILWRFKKAKGLDDWVSDERSFELLKAKMLARTGGSRSISMGGKRLDLILGVNVPDRGFG